MKKNEAVSETRLALDGSDFELISVSLDGETLTEANYTLTKEQLILSPELAAFELVIVTRLKPQENTALEGLYKSSGMYCTQCEAEGFRRITYFLHRPDVMSVYTTTIIADKQHYPVLLSNGNCVESVDIEDGKHKVVWHDPFAKPSYLFALVAGNLVSQEDFFTTQSGRKVKLQIFVEPSNIDKCTHALISLKKAMRWDEETFGREYDLDIFMIVAVNDFNMGAMENKGLNIFNSACVLAKPETATDQDYDTIESIIGHEYFHNWSGNRVTCRDWFQLSLKEGFTVFRDQEFSADMGSRAEKRISDVNVLRTAQFAEDAGPMAHPVRPESYMDISNFYTVTIYNKGAEVVRMLETLVGREGFRKGCDLYFERHDGQAVTTDDFVQAIEDANQRDFSQFRRWYTQAGTPELSVKTDYDSEAKRYSIELTQSCPATPGQSEKLPFEMPVKFGLIDQNGSPIDLDVDGEAKTSVVLDLTQEKQKFVFSNIDSAPTPSLLRQFSAPVKLNIEYSDSDLMFLMVHDEDEFNRWEAGQRLALRVIENLMLDHRAGKTMALSDEFINAYSKILSDQNIDKALAAQALTLPNEKYIAEQQSVVDPELIHHAREFVMNKLATTLAEQFMATYEQLCDDGAYHFDAESMATRSLKNTCLFYLQRASESEGKKLALTQFDSANNMTDSFAALSALAHFGGDAGEEVLARFYDKWKADQLVVDKWFGVQARADYSGVLESVKRLRQHEAFDITNPNKVRALVVAFCFQNMAHFHQPSGDGYRFLADHVLELNALNPQMASRIAAGFSQWRRIEPSRQVLMKAELERIQSASDLSKDVYEIISKTLG